MKNSPRSVSYTHLDVYKRQGACDTESLTGIWDLQFNAESERHSWGGVILSRIHLDGLPLPCEGEQSYLNQMALTACMMAYPNC